jgi:hypothetical protein
MIAALLVALVPTLQDGPPTAPDEPEFVSQVPS